MQLAVTVSMSDVAVGQVPSRKLEDLVIFTVLRLAGAGPWPDPRRCDGQR